MPEPELRMKSTWADEVEEGDSTELPGQSITWDKDVKTVVEYKRNDDGKKVKVIRQFRVETKKVLKAVARRRTLKKFGQSKDDGAGPDPATTVPAEEVFMQFVTNKEFDDQQNADGLMKLKQQSFVRCRICKQEHWTSSCPYKDKLGEVPILTGAKPKDEKPALGADEKAKPGKYIPPLRREGGMKAGESMSSHRKDMDLYTIRVTNLSESAREGDLQELFKPFGSISRVFLGKDKISGASKGFAFVSFNRQEDAAKAIKAVNGHGYDHLILSVEWSNYLFCSRQPTIFKRGIKVLGLDLLLDRAKLLRRMSTLEAYIRSLALFDRLDESERD
ncbi:unnamed protein product [Notodromas monacha]|uniref:Eukaryotic translation initiation factor 3 subunit G n=1 Tax=Notodromas monacha TaxID=399045 RepID=A0A7R9BUJ2_9CRUS|nr:unnamed protein product [Notodromas monacha]CAG0920950.1 unnamed protein product [Notodromas monacha]